MDDTARYQAILQRDRSQDGQFLTGVLSTGIYCLPSCPARKPRFEHVRFFPSEAAAQAAGLRACKRCQPDLFYRGQPSGEACYEALRALLRDAPAAPGDVNALAARTGVSRRTLHALCREHGQTTPARLLRSARLDWAADTLLRSQDHVADIGYAAGFASEAVFHRQFRQAHALTPAAYRALGHSTHFTLSLPSAYCSEEVLAYLGRDAQGPAERRDGQQLCKAVLLDGEPFRLSLHLDGTSAHCRVAGAQSPSAAQMRTAHHMALRCLGLSGQVAGFERSARQHPALAPLLARRPGLHFPLSATVFESLVWAIVGQQVNLAFAATLRRVVIELAGQPAGEGMLAHPSVAAVAALDPATLCTRQFSRSKAAYLVDTARYLLEHGIDIEQLPHWSFPAALRRLTAIRGIGPWTAQYTLLRGGGFADCVPVGDVGLTAALQRQFQLGERPKAEATQALMAPFAPWRSLATAHLWASLSDKP